MKASTGSADSTKRVDMIGPSFRHPHQGADYEETTDVQNVHAFIGREKSSTRVTIRPFSLWALAVYGLVIFLAGFCWSRYVSTSSNASLNPGNPVLSEQNMQTLPAVGSRVSAVADANAPTVVHVIMKDMKFDPPAVEVKSGDVVEWKNEDITPHTATSVPLFDSGSIDSEKSWRHTFTDAGNFPYSCTFHPEMKATVTVK
jgi:plastocyanin